ncbi:hypothetical protein [Mucilaginibacter aquaedulcis]|uniref:hypothetical protein n=1 Tax=Mucilaginibacter aquaedulcis TaxID=1187081 RepID=UPI0025B4C28E|nr:hypothetical protein [Mucilaginibacter aquaedulcis]MDN3548702.1 hypothetical protein [Mucilaginibacter aquaedulcis]
MKKSTLILAAAALAFASCSKTAGVSPVSPAAEISTTAAKHDGADDNVKHDVNDDNQPKHSGNDDKNITVPAKVLAAFNKAFPGVAVREWKLTSDGLYKAHFTKSGVAYEASFKANGTLIKSQRAS